MARHTYDDLTDSLLISTKKKSDKVKGSATIGDIIIDITHQGKIVGLEIKHISKFLKKFKVPKGVEEIASATMSISYKPDSVMIWIYLKFEKGKEERLPVYISTESPHVAEAGA